MRSFMARFRSVRSAREHPTQRPAWHAHVGAILFYTILAVALSWPVARDFTTTIPLHPDAKHGVWINWHVQQALAGNEPLFYSNLLYYPRGITLLATLGPATGVFALPFWVWGAEAAYNGGMLVSFVLSGYCMYLLARSLQFTPGLALLAGTILMSSPMCVSGFLGNITRVFLAGLPLVLLTFQHALNPHRSPWWALATALALLLTLLHYGYHFVLSVLAMSFFSLAAYIMARPQERWLWLWRNSATALACLVIVGPLLVAVARTSRDTALDIAVHTFSSSHDVLWVVLPPYFSQLYGAAVMSAMHQFQAIPTVDTAVSMATVGLLLCGVALFRGTRKAQVWTIFTLLFVLLSLGPVLIAFGQSSFTDYQLPMMMPYALLTSLPGFEFIRAPGRIMQMAYVGFGIAACFGLHVVFRGRPRRQRSLMLLLVITLVLVENWPVEFARSSLPPVPDFYHQIAEDEETYGVFDIPVMRQPLDQSSYLFTTADYQVQQITHHKGIAGGRLARNYVQHPFFPHLIAYDFPTQSDNFRVNNQPANVYASTQQHLAALGYRYIVWHKWSTGNPELDRQGTRNARQFVRAVLGDQQPIISDDLVNVYAIDPSRNSGHLTTTLSLGQNWHSDLAGEGFVWATSPATLVIHSPAAQYARLHIEPARIHDPDSANGMGDTGTMYVQSSFAVTEAVKIQHGQESTVPLLLPRGTQTITLTLQAGNFRLTDYQGWSQSRLSFAIQKINLATRDEQALPKDIYINEDPLHTFAEAPPLMAMFGNGWYDFEETSKVRWARSPAHILVASDTAARVQVRMLPQMLHSATSPNGLVANGTLLVAVNGEHPQAVAAQIGEPATVAVDLQQGINQLTIALEAGNFQPHEVTPDNPDKRTLSFALEYIDIVSQE